MKATETTDVPGRLMSQDALRGAGMFMSIGGAGLIFALCKWLGIGSELWSSVVFWLGVITLEWIFPLASLPPENLPQGVTLDKGK